MKKLVAYFSATGTTQNVAKKIAKGIGADLFEIEPKQKYTDADLNWQNEKSRSSVEMKNPNSRPEIVKKVANIADYETVVIGFPVWWYTAPTIINTFIEQNNLDGKDIYIFVTSGGSGVEGTLSNLKQAYPQLNFVAGRRLKTTDDGKILIDWIS